MEVPGSGVSSTRLRSKGHLASYPLPRRRKEPFLGQAWLELLLSGFCYPITPGVSLGLYPSLGQKLQTQTPAHTCVWRSA